MSRTFLCGNTGVINRGCEAIVRATVKVLGGRNGDITLATFAPMQDAPMAREMGIDMISYGTYPSSVHRYASAAIKKIFKKSVSGMKYIQKPLFDRLQKDDIVLNIGGDTYCYNRPIVSIALNRYTSKNKITNILWCCSIEKGKIKDEIFEDLNRYKYIFAREQITYDNLVECGIPKEKIIRVCDPAFFLDMKEVELPNGFSIGNTVGINLSEMVIRDGDRAVYDNVKNTISWILENTDMSICLVPHVYNIEQNRNDWPILKRLYDDFNADSRVSLVDKEYDCEELKYIISKCRFFIGARTHSTIAAYSTEVPTLVIGYSVKSLGIATDLFGTAEDYVLPYGEIKSDGELLSAFVKLMSREKDIKRRYAEFLPEYRKRLTDAVRLYVNNEKEKPQAPFICPRNLCTGCGACALSCPESAITMKSDAEGFLYPVIDGEKCIHCGKCERVCPVSNRFEDDNQKPETYALINRDEDVRIKSSSGGAFYLLARDVISRGGAVFGAGFDEELSVRHICVKNLSELGNLMGSKYVQSTIGNSYCEAKALLENGIEVLFSGTPCQIAGLRAYLQKDYESLLTVDIICHGVPSPSVFEKYKEELRLGRAIKRISFRDKTYGWGKYSVAVDFENGETLCEPASENSYMRGYLTHLYMRPSCHRCAFRNMHRQSDITLADFWGVDEKCPEMSDGKGTSLLLIHSERGRLALNGVKDDAKICEIDFEKAINTVGPYFVSPKESPFRDEFFKRMKKKEVSSLVKRFYGTGALSKIRRFKSKYLK